MYEYIIIYIPCTNILIIITIITHFITIITKYIYVTIYYIDIVIDYNKLYIYIYIDYIIISIIYYIIKTEYLYSLKHSIETVLITSFSNVYSYFTYMIGFTERSHVAPKMQHVTFCDSIVRFDWCPTNCIDSVCGGGGTYGCPFGFKDESVITWGRGKGRPRHVVSCRPSVRWSEDNWVTKTTAWTLG